MAAPVIPATDIQPTGVKITWTLLNTDALSNNCSSTGYLLEWAPNSENPWTALTADTYSSANFVWTGFSPATTYKFRIKAKNPNGLSAAYSSITAITTDAVPAKMGRPQAAAANINPTNALFTWTNLTTATETGGDPITHYSLEWASSASTWTVLNTDTSQLLANITHNFGSVCTSGSTRVYRIRARNRVGWGPYSDN